MIPVAGMIFGAYMNKTAIQDVGEAANMLYKKRRVLERLERLDNLDLLITDKKEPTT